MLQKVERPSLRDALRRETSRLHDMLEARVERAGHFRSAAGYRAWLVRMQRLHLGFAAAQDAGCARLGLPPQSAGLAAALAEDVGPPPPVPARAVTDEMEAVGVTYVFEGSALGGRLLLARVAELGPVPTAYLAQLVGASPGRWPRLRAACGEMQVAGPAGCHPAVLGARSVFDAFLDAFDPCLP